MNAISQISSSTAIALARGWNVIDSDTYAASPANDSVDTGAVAEPVEIAEPEPVEPEPTAEAPAPEPFKPASAMVEREPLTKAFDIVKRVVEARTHIPIMANACLRAAGDALSITATDLDIEIRVTVPCAIDNHFAVTAPAHLLESFLKKAAKCDLVAINTDEDGASIEFERAKYRVHTLPVADFPEMSPGTLTHSFTMPGKALWNMVDGTMVAISSEETRYYLNGIYAHVVQHGNMHAFTMVATDGHRLYRQEIEAQDGALGMPGVILPRKLVDLFWTLTKGKSCPETVEIAVSNTKARLKFGNIEILSKLIDGTFPDYQRVIPSGNSFPMTFDRDTMAEALKSVALISSEKGRAVKLCIGGGHCMLVVNNPDAGRAESTIPVSWDASEFEIGVNTGYLENVLDDAGAGEITMNFAEALRREESGKWTSDGAGHADCGSPIRITGQREGWDAVLMPMRV